MFGPEVLKSVAGLVGVEINENNGEEYNTEDEKETLENKKTDVKDLNKTNYNIRKGREDDVLKDNRKVKDNLEQISSRISDYSYEDFEKEFLHEKTNEELYEEDSRPVAEYEMQDGGTYEAGRVLDKEYLVVATFGSLISLLFMFCIFR